MQIDPPPSTAKTYEIPNGPSLTHSAWFEIRLFYIRISPCVTETAPDRLTLRSLRRDLGVSLEINALKIPTSDAASLTLRRDRIDKESSEVTYVATDSVRLTGGVEFEVYDDDVLVLLGSLERMEGVWSMECCMAGNCSGIFRGKVSPAVEVYVAGCCSGVPVIFTKTIVGSPRRKGGRQFMLDAIPEEEEEIRQQKMQMTESEIDEYESEGKLGQGFYSDEMYMGEDGQLTWFNAGVRVGVGIGLGMCLGIGIGVGLLMHSYQATTSNFRRRFL